MNGKQLDKTKVERKEPAKSQVKAKQRRPRANVKAQFKAALDNRYMDLDEWWDLESQGAW